MPNSQTDQVRVTVDTDGETCLLIRTKDMPTVHPAVVPHIHLFIGGVHVPFAAQPGDTADNLRHLAFAYLALADHVERTATA